MKQGTKFHFEVSGGFVVVWPIVNDAGDPRIDGYRGSNATTIRHFLIGKHPRPRAASQVMRFEARGVVPDGVDVQIIVEEATDPSSPVWAWYDKVRDLIEKGLRGSEFLDTASALVIPGAFHEERGRPWPEIPPPPALPSTSKAEASGAKPRPSLVPVEALHGAIAALGLGAEKYGANNWREIPIEDFRRLYRDAFLRHVIAAWSGEIIDPESGNAHLDHALACLLLLRARGVESLRGGA
jgi:hypothetical protein